jgi:hypothetical protein
MAPFLGMRGTGDWSADERPKAWREGILYYYPNGKAPLTAITSKIASEKVEDPEYNWWTQKHAEQSGTITGVYTDSGLTTPYVSGGAKDATLYVKMSEADSKEFRAGHQVLLRCAADYRVDVNAKVTDVVRNGASSYLTVKLLEADDNAPAIVGAIDAHDLSDADRVVVIGNINSEGAAMPSAITHDPVKYSNVTQIFRTPLSLTRTALQTKLRTPDAYQRAKKEAMEMHSIEIEKAFIWGIRTEEVGDNGKLERTTMGLVPLIKQYASANCDDYTLNATYAGKTWLEGGEDWLDAMCEKWFQYGENEKLVFAGSGAILGINRLIKARGQFQFVPKTMAYGIQVWEWVTPFGTIYLKTHPLFAMEPTMRHAMLSIEPKNLRYRYVQDTMFKKDDTMRKGGAPSTAIDGINEEYLTECGLEYLLPVGFGYINGVGLDNTLVIGEEVA